MKGPKRQINYSRIEADDRADGFEDDYVMIEDGN